MPLLPRSTTSQLWSPSQVPTSKEARSVLTKRGDVGRRQQLQQPGGASAWAWSARPALRSTAPLSRPRPAPTGWLRRTRALAALRGQTRFSPPLTRTLHHYLHITDPLLHFGPLGLSQTIPLDRRTTSLSLLPPRPSQAPLRTQFNLYPPWEVPGDQRHPWSPPLLHCGPTTAPTGKYAGRKPLRTS